MAVIFITGMSGTGTSTLIERLKEAGYHAVDLDEPPWSKYDDEGDWIWKEPRVEELLDQTSELLFVSGCPTNQTKFYDRFDLIILLSAPTAVIKTRLRTRTNNSYGKSPEELAEVLGNVETVEPLLRNVADHEIDTTIPVEEVVEEVLRVTESV